MLNPSDSLLNTLSLYFPLFRRTAQSNLLLAISLRNDFKSKPNIQVAPQYSSGAASKKDEAIGKSRGGRSTQIHLAVDSYGLPVDFELSGGQAHDIVHAESLVVQSPPSDFVIADKGYDSQAFRNDIEQQGATAVIPYRKNNRKSDKKIDNGLYRYRHLVENAFARIKHFRAIATRYDKLARNYASTLALAFVII
ncbi:hypothetical protein XCR1_830009 [Xenorhabdus cabanillasii JM26]|uniref:Transposase IS4-like domain-containing protein n=1 Tax=Xenorhabdus cabanillasii JM26 TaxID=1427517 RepID=W1J8J7_9GAMM|nr:hypothetical protein XCR1_830009 [Xenorhabdus cabanillasii JM26]